MKKSISKILLVLLGASLFGLRVPEAKALVVPRQQSWQSYYSQLKPFQKAYSESLKPQYNLKDLAQALTYPIQTFQNLERFFPTTFHANPICFGQGERRLSRRVEFLPPLFATTRPNKAVGAAPANAAMSAIFGTRQPQSAAALI